VVVFRHRFHVTDSYTYVDIKGPGGETWWTGGGREGVSAHRGNHHRRIMPNLFFLLGPNTALGHNSVVFMIESQIRYAAQAIARRGPCGCAGAGAESWPPRTATTTSCRMSWQARFWNTGGCRSWYMDEHGVNRTLWDGMTWQYWLATRKFKPAEYEFVG